MLNTCTFLIEDFQQQHQLIVESGDDALIAFIIRSTGDLKKLITFYGSYPFSENLLFSLYFDIENVDQFYTRSPEIESLLFTLFFHPCFKITAEQPLLFFSQATKEKKEMQRLIQTLHSTALEQGFMGIQLIGLTSQYQPDHHLILKSAELDAYFSLLDKEGYASRYLAVLSDSASVDFKRLKEIENQFSHKNPDIYKQLKKIKQLEAALSQTQQTLQYTSLQLKNQKTYLDLFRQQDEANKINRFYYNEYEVLPLWYKRLGHLIKVLMGKRSFRSLYDSNTKKYKN